MIAVATRVAVMRRGNVTAVLEGDEITESKILRIAVD